MSALDHLMNGRVGRNIMTGYLNSAAKASSTTSKLITTPGKTASIQPKES
jgi:hypothetical protein